MTVPRRLPALGDQRLIAGLLLVLVLSLVMGVAADVPVLVVMGGVGAALLEPPLERAVAAERPHLSHLVRGLLPLHPLLLLAQVLRADRLSQALEAVVVVCVAGFVVLRLAHQGLGVIDRQLRNRRAEVRGLPGGVAALPPRTTLLGAAGLQALALADLLLPLSLLVASLTGSYVIVPAATVLLALLGLAVALAAARSLVPLLRAPRGDRLVRLAHQAVLRHAPQAVLYMGEGPGDVHCVTAWLRTLEALNRPALVMLRDPRTLAALPATPIPAVCLPSPQDVRIFSLPSAPVALFVTNGRLNVDIARDVTLQTVLIGHGDSDKTVGANPVAKIYDQVWVAGPAAARRQELARVRPDQLRIIGRPQVRGVQPGRPPAPGAPYTVLYAPTWEGLYADPFESSLAHSGLDIVRALLSVQGVRVVFRPHPKSGVRDPAHRRAHQAVIAELAAAGPQHRVSTPAQSDLYTTFNEVDALVADISAVVSDFLASEKPYFVVDGRGRPEDAFRAEYPTASAAYLVGPGGAGLVDGVAAARTDDPLRERRRALRADLLGPVELDPLEAFARALDALSP